MNVIDEEHFISSLIESMDENELDIFIKALSEAEKFDIENESKRKEKHE